MKRLVARRAFPVFLAAATVVCLAGDLTPPGGPVTSTMKTLTEVEPRVAVQSLGGGDGALFRIEQPGSYYLTANITGVAGANGINIVASGVTLDLNGFVLVGVPGSIDGVNVTGGALESISIKNGTVMNWGQRGVDLGCGMGTVENIVARDNGDLGIHANGLYVVKNCMARRNGGQFGIGSAHHSRIVDCVSMENTGRGFHGGTGTTITGCIAVQNGGDGFWLEAGTSTGFGIVSVIGCTSFRNAGIGFQVTVSGVVRECGSSENSGGGIRACDSLIQSCTATNNTNFNIDGCATSTLVENHAPTGPGR